MSANDTKETAKPPMTTGTRSANGIQGIENVGRPRGSEPSTEIFARSARSKKEVTAVARNHGDEDAGKALAPLYEQNRCKGGGSERELNPIDLPACDRAGD